MVQNNPTADRDLAQKSKIIICIRIFNVNKMFSYCNNERFRNLLRTLLIATAMLSFIMLYDMDGARMVRPVRMRVRK